LKNNKISKILWIKQKIKIGTLPFNPRAALATWLNLEAPQKLPKK
jgi:hypothetical protein